LDRWGVTVAVALDISRAFDRVWHRALISKLPAYGFTQPWIHLLDSYLNNRSFEVVVGGMISNKRHTNAGVPQGSSLSATLFLIFINDLLTITVSNTHAYADDTTLHSDLRYKRAPSTKLRGADALSLQDNIQSDLELISAWGESNAVNFNADKTKAMMVDLLKAPMDINLTFEQRPLEYDSYLDILGVRVSDSLSWRTHLMSLVSGAAGKLGALYRVARFFSPEQILKIYKSNIRPHLEYCSHIWGGSSSVWVLERVDRRARRLISDPDLRDGLQPLQRRRDVAALSVFYKIYHGMCSTELGSLIPPPVIHRRPTRAAVNRHQYYVEPISCRIERFKRSFIPRTSVAWNALPPEVFPIEFSLDTFKGRLNALLPA
jgi:hypothetical protein